jgi:hypothetical protein
MPGRGLGADSSGILGSSREAFRRSAQMKLPDVIDRHWMRTTDLAGGELSGTRLLPIGFANDAGAPTPPVGNHSHAPIEARAALQAGSVVKT